MSENDREQAWKSAEPVIPWDTLDPLEAEALRGPDADGKKDAHGYLSQAAIWEVLRRKDEE
jgi:hypothetical protein